MHVFNRGGANILCFIFTVKIMATSSECDLTTIAMSKGICITPDRRKHAFKSLVSDIAERLENKDVKNICWQMELPNSLEKKAALEALKWLVKHGRCSDTDIQPLAQLLKDIRREDLAGRVETFQKEFGKDHVITTMYRESLHVKNNEYRRLLHV